MPRDYIPLNRADYRAWLTNLELQAPQVGPGLGANPADVTQMVAAAAAQLARMKAVDAAKVALRAARAQESDGRREANQFLRRKLGQWKVMENFGPVQELALKARSRAPVFDERTSKPSFKARVTVNGIRLDWRKRGFDAVMVYGRVGGGEWKKLGMDTLSPFLDTRPLAAPGVPEVREYRMLGVIKDQEVGQYSNTISVTWGGE